MNTPAKLGGFGAALAVTLLASFGVGNVVGPVGQEVTTHDEGGHAVDDGTGHTSTGASTPGNTSSNTPSGDHDVAGLMVSESGYTLSLGSTVLAAGTTPVELRILGPDGTAVTEFDEAHDKELHLIAVRRDTTGFQHVHPTMDADGTWHASLDLTPGAWRLFADFQPRALGDGLTLGIDASVAGPYTPEPMPAESRTAEVDGYTVTLDGDLTAGGASELTLGITKDGAPVTDLQPYLGAYGHLVALRAGDLAYLHVHPDGEPGDGSTEPGPDVTFFATVPTAGWYRLFLDFRHDGVVRTAAFTVPAGNGDGDGDGGGIDEGQHATTTTGGDGHGH